MKTINYICFYSDQLGDRKDKKIFPAANDKSKYIIDCLSELGYKVNVFSLCSNVNKSSKDEIVNDGNVTYYYFKSYKRNIFGKIWNKLFFKKRAFSKINKIIKDQDIVMVYHSLYYLNKINKLAKTRNVKIIKEIEELYSLSFDIFKGKDKLEKDYCKNANGWLFITDLLPKMLDVKGNYVVSYGNLASVVKTKKQKQNRIRIIYSGNVSKKIYDLDFVIDSYNKLDDRFELCFLPLSNDEEELLAFKNKVHSFNEFNSKHPIALLDSMYGEDYSIFLSTCDIGLVPIIDGNFNETSFPSKVLTYLRHGLEIVSSDYKSLCCSRLASMIHFFDIKDPNDFANSIKDAVNNKINSVQKLNELNDNFKKELKDLIERL